MKDPLRGFTRGIAEAVEHDLAFEAMLADKNLIPATWGHVASQLVEMDVVEPTPAAVQAFLGIDEATLRNPDPAFVGGFDLDMYLDASERRWQADYMESISDSITRFNNYADPLIASWHIKNGDGRARALQDEIDHQMERLRRRGLNPDHVGEIEDQITLLCYERDACASGIVVPLDVFAYSLLTYSTDEVVTREILVKGIDYALGTLFLDSPAIGEKRLGEIIVGKKVIEYFQSEVRMLLREPSFEYARDRAELVGSLFVPPPYWEHPLFAGNEV